MSTKKPSRRKTVLPPVLSLDHRVILARRLDLMAGCELQHGHAAAAEHLSRRAAELREARQ